VAINLLAGKKHIWVWTEYSIQSKQQPLSPQVCSSIPADPQFVRALGSTLVHIGSAIYNRNCMHKFKGRIKTLHGRLLFQSCHSTEFQRPIFRVSNFSLQHGIEEMELRHAAIVDVLIFLSVRLILGENIEKFSNKSRSPPKNLRVQELLM